MSIFRVIGTVLLAAGMFSGSGNIARAQKVASSAAAKSAAAVATLEAELVASSKPTEALGAKPFAKTLLTKADAERARELLFKAHTAAIVSERAAELKDRVLKDGDLEMRFFTKTFGKKPEKGWSLWISLHGGGGAPAAVNDQQYENQKQLYQLTEGIYLAPRAPTNNWNLWHEAHIDRLFGRLIEDMIAIEGVDPDRVYMMGYSAGGDGVYQLGPRMADYWAAAAMMAGHPNDASPLSLRNLPFAIQVGGDDSAFNRNRVAVEWGQKLDELRKDDPDGYEHFVKIHAGKGHWMNLEDKVVLPWMAERRRNPTPKKIVWRQAGTTHDRFYWLAVPTDEAKAGSMVTAQLNGQTIEITAAEEISKLLVRLNDRMLDLDKPVQVKHGIKTLYNRVAPRTIATLTKTLLGRGDPQLMFDAEVEVKLPQAAAQRASD